MIWILNIFLPGVCPFKKNVVKVKYNVGIEIRVHLIKDSAVLLKPDDLKTTCVKFSTSMANTLKPKTEKAVGETHRSDQLLLHPPEMTGFFLNKERYLIVHLSIIHALSGIS